MDTNDIAKRVAAAHLQKSAGRQTYEQARAELRQEWAWKIANSLTVLLPRAFDLKGNNLQRKGDATEFFILDHNDKTRGYMKGTVRPDEDDEVHVVVTFYDPDKRKRGEYSNFIGMGGTALSTAEFITKQLLRSREGGEFLVDFG